MNPTKAIVAATIALLTLLPIAGAQGSYQHNDPPPAPIEPLKPFQIKWILAPGQSSADIPFVNGYPTVDFDDPTYPPRNP